jgi:hypothetical protein
MMSSDLTPEQESVRRTAFSLALWDGATDDEAHKEAEVRLLQEFPELSGQNPPNDPH